MWWRRLGAHRGGAQMRVYLEATSTHAGHMYSLLQKEEQMIRVHGMSMRQTTAWRCSSRSCSTVPGMDVVFVNKSWHLVSTRTSSAPAWRALTTKSMRTRTFLMKVYCSTLWRSVLLRGTRKDLQGTTSHCCPHYFHIQSRPTPFCRYRFVSTSPRRPTFEAFGGRD